MSRNQARETAFSCPYETDYYPRVIVDDDQVMTFAGVIQIRWVPRKKILQEKPVVHEKTWFNEDIKGVGGSIAVVKERCQTADDGIDVMCRA